ncbi:MAG: PQQ-binding-like beta-propeller repeat protein, partial [Aureliella sp.]
RIAWKVSVGEAWSGFAVQGDVAVTMEQRGEQEWVAAYSVLDGVLLWRAAIDSKHSNALGGVGPRSTPTIFGNRVYATSAVSRLLCLELATGQEIWSQDLLSLAGVRQTEFEKEVAWGRSASPLIVDDLVVIPLGGVGAEKHTLIAFDRMSGQERWRGGSDQISYASPALVELSGQRQILLLSEKKLASYDIQTGSQLWSTPWPGNSNGSASVSQPVVVDPSHVLISKGYGEGCQYLQINHVDNSWTVDVLWTKQSSLRTKFTNCVVRDGYAYGLSDGIVECVRLKDGQQQWKKGRYRQGQLLLVGEDLLITAESGELVLVQVDPRGMKELGKLAVIGDVTWNTAALSGDRLLMRNADEAACVLLPMQTSSTAKLINE